MTQQPDPFSELRGLIATYEGVTEPMAVRIAARDKILDRLPALLDERDRLDTGLRERGMRLESTDPITDALNALVEWKGYADEATARALSAEGEVEKLKAAAELAVHRLSLIHSALTDPSRPRQAIGEMAYVALTDTRQALSQEIG